MKRCRKCNHFVSPLAKHCPHCPVDKPVFDANEKRKGWATPYGFGDFTNPVTYAEACEQMKKVAGYGAEFFAEAKRRAKAKQKKALRAELARGNHAWVYSYCVAKSRVHGDAMRDLLLHGTSSVMVTQEHAEWVLRYFRRLTGKALPKEQEHADT